MNPNINNDADSDWEMLRSVLHDTQPEMPSVADWNRVRQNLSDTWLRRNRTRPWMAFAIVASLAASVAVSIVSLNQNQNPNPHRQDTTVANVPEVPKVELARETAPAPQPVLDPLSEFAVLPIARNTDVTLRVVRGNSAEGIFVVEQPISGTMKLVKENDVQVRELGSNAEVSQPEVGDTPVIIPVP